MDLKNELNFIFSHFKVYETCQSFETFNSGHINDTYLIITKEKPHYVLQRINANVFKLAQEVIENKVKVSNFLLEKSCKTLQFIPLKGNNYYFKDTKNNYWNLSYYIENSQTFTRVNSTDMAYEAGKITGQFLNKIKTFQGNLIPVLPNFHNMSFRFSQFDNALKNANSKRKEAAAEFIDFCISKKEEMQVLDKAIINKEIPLRIIHNDTKISNVLFDNHNKAICLIDLDTVMEGIIHFDYGDAIRTICNTTEEDEKNIEDLNFNLGFFKKYTEGFFKSTKNELSKNELKYLAVSPKIMTFIMALRFLTDYLNYDLYYKTAYKEHNLVRAKNQFTLVKKIIENQQEIDYYIKSLVV